MGARDAMRGYLGRLREGQEISQEAVANYLGITRKSWGDYERGHTEDMRYGVVMSVFRFLHGSFSDISELTDPNATIETGRQLANARLEEISSGNLAAMRKSVSTREYDVFLNELEEEVKEQARFLPRLSNLFQRRPRGSPPERNGHDARRD